MIKEYITQNSQSDGDAFKGIYERLDSKIGQYEATIKHLTDELMAARKNDLPFAQIANEISAAYPQIRRISIGQGAHIEIEDLTVDQCLVVNVQTDTLMDEATLEQFRKWIKIRLQIDNTDIENTILK